MAIIHDVVVDCRHPASLARFWAAALDDYAVAPYDEAELAWLRSNGIAAPDDDPTLNMPIRALPYDPIPLGRVRRVVLGFVW
jgi:Glyoxalase-like domain